MDLVISKIYYVPCTMIGTKVFLWKFRIVVVWVRGRLFLRMGASFRANPQPMRVELDENWCVQKGCSRPTFALYLIKFAGHISICNKRSESRSSVFFSTKAVVPFPIRTRTHRRHMAMSCYGSISPLRGWRSHQLIKTLYMNKLTESSKVNKSRAIKDGEECDLLLQLIK